MSLQPKDLRIGNLVNKYDEFAEVWINGYEIEAEDILALRDGINSYECIPLTPEWLIRGGFVLHNPGNYYARTWGENGVSILVFRKEYNLWCYQLGKGLDKPIEYIHQLQNLFHSLTGKELEFKI